MTSSLDKLRAGSMIEERKAGLIMNRNAPIGMLDSGMGGLSVLLEAMKLLPNEDFLYYGDQLHAPYGTKEPSEVMRLVDNAVSFLIEKGCKAIVIACNTATGVAAQAMRQKYNLPIIGIEPALKPAQSLRNGGKVLVMATPVTLKQEKFRHLFDMYGQDTLLCPCPGLMDMVEKGVLSGPELDSLLDSLLQNQPLPEVKVVVLGCTHYSFLSKAIARHFPAHTQVIDGNGGTVRQLKRRLEECGLSADSDRDGAVTLMSSSDDEKILYQMRALLNF